jgi:hypothetical protein
MDFPAADVMQPQQGLTFAETLTALHQPEVRGASHHGVLPGS